MRRTTAALALIVFTFTGCYRWSETESFRPRLARESQTVRIWFADSCRMVLQDARVRGDTLLGWIPTEVAGPGARTATSYLLPIEGAERLEIREQDATAPLIVLGTVAAVALTATWFCAEDAIWC